LELLRLLIFTTGFALAQRGGAIVYEEFLLWSGTIVHTYLAGIMLVAMLDTRGLQYTVVRRGFPVGTVIGGLTVICGAVLIFAPVPAPVMWLGLPRPWELLPGGLWAASGILLYLRGEWQRDTFVHWLLVALIFAAGAALFLFPFIDLLTDSYNLMAQIFKLTAFMLVLVGLANSMFELVRRVEDSRRAMHLLNNQLEQQIQVRRETERALRASRAELAEAQQISRLGSWGWTPGTNHYQVSPELLQIFGEPALETANPFELIRSRIHPDDLTRVENLVYAAVAHLEDFETYARIVHRDGAVRMIMLRGRRGLNEEGAQLRYRGTAQDLTELVETQEQLRATADRLAASNRDLEEFANIASHDLQEPLRKIFAFSDRVISKYADRLDATGLDYLDRVRKSALRMQNLIEGVLNLSRVNSRSTPFVAVDLAAVVEEVVDDLETRIEARNATVEVETLPRVMGDPLLLRQLFQNLVGNALKFSHADRAPVVRITTLYASAADSSPPEPVEREAVEREAVDSDATDTVASNTVASNTVAPNTEVADTPLVDAILRPTPVDAGGIEKGNRQDNLSIKTQARLCTIVVEDQGIGFDPRYAERIFQPFLRLHGRAKYEGTGMGLAICRRIVERHGGQIWAESQPARGSRFLITLPLAEDSLLATLEDAAETPQEASAAGA
ncbi:MAG: ATP-binding protein, partial [Litorilinea sp.]